MHDPDAVDNRNVWLVKFAPFRTPWENIVQRGTFTLRGVRNLAARKHLTSMRIGDEVLYYHSQKELAVVGLMQVSREAYPDPTSADPQWLTCDFTPLRSLPRPVRLAELKADSRFTTLALLNQPRLAVMPVAYEHFKIIVEEMGL